MRKDTDDLSRMVDVYSMPMEKFKHEVEQVSMLHSSFEILSVELEKQREYIRKFDLDPRTIDQDYFVQSEEYESKLSQEEIISVGHLREFCDDLSKMIHTRLSAKRQFLADRDQYTKLIIHELKEIKVAPGIFFSLSVYGFIKRMVRTSIASSPLKNLLQMVIVYLLSRIRKLNIESYRSQLRTAILVYRLAGHAGMNKSQVCAITGAALIDHLKELGMSMPQQRLAAEERQMVQNYYRAANKLFNDELTFITSVIDALKPHAEVSLAWTARGAKMIVLVREFDSILRQSNFDQAVLSHPQSMQRLRKACALPECDSYCSFLAHHWRSLIPKQLMGPDRHMPCVKYLNWHRLEGLFISKTGKRG